MPEPTAIPSIVRPERSLFVVNAANARYASGTAPQSDVLRAEVEVARLQVVRVSRRTAALRVVEMSQPALAAAWDIRSVPGVDLKLEYRPGRRRCR